jgi:5-methylcytosine-specific restriction endonuclease McrA
MPQQYTDEERAQARARMRRLRADPEYAQRDRDAARERMRRLRNSRPRPPRQRSSQTPRLSRLPSYIGSRRYKKVYDSWYTLRRRAIANGEPVDEILTLEQWQEIVLRYDNRCLACGEQKPLTFDHVIPIKLGGRFAVDNVQPLCLSCNISKKDRYIDYRVR